MSAVAPAAQIDDPNQRVCCRVVGCQNWTTADYDRVCVYHINKLPSDKYAEYYKACEKGVGNFGMRVRDKASFAAVFHPAMFCTDDARLPTAQVQAIRALMIEHSYNVGEKGMLSWQPNVARYLFVVMNPGHGERKGAFYDNPHDVFECVHNQSPLGNETCYYPSDFDFYIIDPTVPQEMDFLVSIMEDKADTENVRIDEEWWETPYVEARRRFERK